MAQFNPPKQWVLSETETITSFANWKSNILYHLSINNQFARFLEGEWSKQSVTNRGLTNDGEDVAEADRKSAVQKKVLLERMLGLIAQFVPSLLRNEIIKKSTSLSWIWQRIRKHYSFTQSEINFLRLSTIQRQENERYETFYQRIVAHIEDNLLSVASGLTHDGEPVTVDEEMSPTTERLAVYLWLTLIDKRLPSYISRVYAHDLQSKSLKDIQPRICDALDSLLGEITAQEEIQIQYSKSSYRKPSDKFRQYKAKPQLSNNSSSKSCVICKAAGRSHQGHDLSSCWFLSKFEKLEMAKALRVNVDEIDEIENIDEASVSQLSFTNSKEPTENSVNKVQCDISPYFYAFYKHHPCQIVVDTGATSSVVSKVFLQAAGIEVHPTLHSARTADKSPLDVKGEVKFTLNFGNLELPISAVVIDTLDCDILGGIPFCKENDIQVHLKDEQITVNSMRIPYGAKSSGELCHEIYRTETFILRNDTAKVILPGEFVEVTSDTLQGYNGEIAIEPRKDSPLGGEWPSPAISRVIQGAVRIPNLSSEPVQLSTSQHFAQIRRVALPSPTSLLSNETPSIIVSNYSTKKPAGTNHSDAVIIDPNNQLSSADHQSFKNLNKSFDSVFNPNFGAYNDNSGTIRADINIGPVVPPPRKGRLPFYTHKQLQILQEEADKLEVLGVLAKPEDVGVVVKYVSPSFLVNKPNGEYRLVTAFNDLGQYTRILPTVSTSCDQVLRKLAAWKYLIKTDLTKSFYQIKVAKSSIPYLGTVTPFKGLRVYLRSAMGMPGSSEYLQELTSRVFGDFLQEGFLIMIADDMHIGGNTVKEILHNYSRVLQRLQDNNLNISSSKTVICPTDTTILGWKWHAGTLSPTPHKIAPLSSVAPPSTCSSMRSFIGAYKALSRCIPRYASLISPLEDSIKGMQGSQKVEWSDDLRSYFKQAQDALRNPRTLTIPVSSDKLILTVDASPSNKGLGATLYVLRGEIRYVSEYFSFKLKEHQLRWMPCELEALAIATGVHHFLPYIRESLRPLQILTDSKPCVQAYNKLCKGQFSASPRVSSFLSTLSGNNITMCHLPGDANRTSDFGSRNPLECADRSCQICKFVDETISSVVAAITVSDILNGTATMPFMNTTAWKSAQHDDPHLRRAYAHLTQGTRPSRKARNLKDLRRYLNVISVNENGLLIVRKADPYTQQRSLIVVPRDILPGLLTALHLHLKHPKKSELTRLFNRYFFGLHSDTVIAKVVGNCELCESLKSVPSEIFEQSSTPSPTSPGQQFAADVMRRNKQKVFVVRDVLSSFTSATIIADETADSLRAGLLINTCLLRAETSTVRVDGATGFLPLKNDQILQSHGLMLDFGRAKNANKNPVAEKCIQELESELLRNDPSGSPVSTLTLQLIVDKLNSRIRNRGLSAKEIILQRDQHTKQQLTFDDESLSQKQQSLRKANHPHSAASKSKSGKPALKAKVSVGDLVFLKSERSKLKARERYMIIKLEANMAIIQKMTANGKFMGRQYKVPLTDIYKINDLTTEKTNLQTAEQSYESSDSEDYVADVASGYQSDSDREADDMNDNDNVNGDNEAENVNEAVSIPQRESIRPRRTPRQPAWLASGDYITE